MTPIKSYYPNGHLEVEGFLIDNVQVGDWRFYHDNGKIFTRGQFDNNGTSNRHGSCPHEPHLNQLPVTFTSMNKSLSKYSRKSFIEIGEIYFLDGHHQQLE
jgi:hypothetical protein